MSLATPIGAGPMTAEEFATIPDDRIDRELIDGIAREIGPTLKDRWHGAAGPRVAYLLHLWLASRPSTRGDVFAGRAGFCLHRGPDTVVGPDVAYATAEVFEQTAPDAPFIEGPPALAVEILARSDRPEDTADRIERYLRAGAVAWEADPRSRTVRVHRAGHLPESFNAAQAIDADAYLPGLVVPVAAIFPARAT